MVTATQRWPARLDELPADLAEFRRALKAKLESYHRSAAGISLYVSPISVKGRRVPAPDVGDIAANRRLTNLRLMLVDETLPHPPRRVPLLPGRLAVSLQPGVVRRR